MEALICGKEMVEWSLAEHYVVMVLPKYLWDFADIPCVGAGDSCKDHTGFQGVLLSLFKLSLRNINKRYTVALFGQFDSCVLYVRVTLIC